MRGHAPNTRPQGLLNDELLSMGMGEPPRPDPAPWDWVVAPDPWRAAKRIAGCAVVAGAVWLIWVVM